MNLEFDRESYLDHITQGTERLAGAGTGLGLERHTAELLQEALYPMGKARPPPPPAGGRGGRGDSWDQDQDLATEEDAVEHESSRSRKALAWEMDEDELDKELEDEDRDDGHKDLVGARGQILLARARARARGDEDELARRRRRHKTWIHDQNTKEGPAWNSRVVVSTSDDSAVACSCMRGLANLSQVQNLRELILTMDSAIRLAATLVRNKLLDVPRKPLRVYRPNIQPCPCSVLGPTMWRMFQEWATRENLGYDLTTHPGELADPERYVRNVHDNFRSYIVGSEAVRRMHLSHADYFARNIDMLELMESEPHAGPLPRQHIKASKILREQQLAERYAPRRGKHHTSNRATSSSLFPSPPQADVESDAHLEFETRQIREKARRLRS